jgi:hypothetical protein
MKLQAMRIVALVVVAVLMGCRGDRAEEKVERPTAKVQTVQSALAPDENTPIGKKWRELFDRGINLGEADAAVQSIPGGAAQYQTFPGAAIVYSNDFGATYMPLNIFNRWLATQNETNSGGGNLFFVLGLPTRDYVASPGHDECSFERGVIILVPGVARVVYGAIYLRYLQVASAIGLPTSEELPGSVPDSRYQTFGNGAIYWRAGLDASAIVGASIVTRFNQTGGPAGPLGFPMSDTAPIVKTVNEQVVQIGESNRFEHGVIFHSSTTGAWEVTDQILPAYETKFGGPGGWLGLPLGPTALSGAGDWFNDFQGGVIVNRGGFYYPFGDLTFHLHRVVAGGDDCGTCGRQDLYYYVDVTSSLGTIVNHDRFPDSGDYDPGAHNTNRDWRVGTANSSVTIYAEIDVWDDDDTSANDYLGSPSANYSIDNLWGFLIDHRHSDRDGWAQFNIKPEPGFDPTNFRGDMFWSFENFDAQNLSYDQFADTFSDVTHDEETWRHPFNKMYYEFAYRGLARPGHCFGMSTESIYAQIGRSPFSEPIGPLYFPYTQDGRELLKGNNGAEDYLIYELGVKHGYQLGVDMVLWAAYMFATGQTHDPERNFWDSKWFEDSRDYAMISIYDDYLFGNGHSVRPYQWDTTPGPCARLSGSNCVKIHIADSNHPPGGTTDMVSNAGIDDFIEIDRTTNFYDYQHAPSSRHYNGGTWTGGRMFFQPFHTVSHTPRTPFDEVWLLLSSGYMMLVGSTGNTKQISDGGGKTFFEPGLADGLRRWDEIRFDNAARIQGVTPVMVTGAQFPSTSQLQMWTGLAEGATHAYEVAPLATTTAGTPIEATFSSGKMSSYFVLPATPGRADKITAHDIGRANKAISLAIPAAGVAKPVAWTVTGTNKQRWMELTSLGMSPAQTIRMQAENAGRRMRVNNSGPGTTANVRYQAGAGVTPRNLGQITIPVGESVIEPDGVGCLSDSACAAGQYCAEGACVARPCNPTATFGALLPVLPSGDAFALSADGKTAYVSDNPSGGYYDLYVTTRATTADPFGPLSALTTVNSWANDRAPWLSQDGLRLYFWNSTLSNGSDDLVMASRSSTTASFGAPQLVPSVNSTSDDSDPFFLPGEQELFFSSSRNGSRDLYMATRTSTGFTTPFLLANVNSTEEDTRPVLTRDGLTLYFRSRRPSPLNDSDGDIWVATRGSSTAAFGSPQNVTVLNTTGSEIPVAVSPDSCTLYFASNRETGLGGTERYRIYKATRGQPPTMVTVTLNIVGNGSVDTAPFACSTGNTGTCSAQLAAGTSMIVWGNRPGYWSGTCAANGAPGLSTDGVVTVTTSNTCTVTFP